MKRECRITRKLLRKLKNLEEKFVYRGEYFELAQRLENADKSYWYFEGSDGDTIEMNYTRKKVGEGIFEGLKRIDNVLIND